jgi:PAS domain S-box-containing protein
MSSSSRDYLLAAKRRLPVTVYLVIFLLAITVPLLSLMALVSHRAESRKELADLHDQASLDADQSAQGLVLPIWNLDENQTAQMLGTVMGNRSIEAVELRAQGLPLIRLERDDAWNLKRGVPGVPSHPKMTEIRSISYGGQTIGELRLEITDRFMREELAAQLRTNLLLYALLEVLLMLALWFMLRRLILRPLKALEGYATAVSREAPGGGELASETFRGELGTLRESIERMVALLGSRLDEASREARLRRESEERLRSIYDSVNDGIIIRASDSLRILEVNSRTCEMYGYTKEEFSRLSVEDISSNIPPFTTEAAMANTRRVMAGESVVTEWNARRKDGSLFWVELAVRRATIGGEDRILVVTRDITERKRQEAERERLEAQLRESHKMESIGLLAGGIAHDFNNILCGLLGFCQLAQAETSGQMMVQEYLGSAIRAVNRATDLVRQILTFSRQGPHEMQPVLLQQVMREVMKLVRAATPDRIEILTEVEPELPAVIADPTQIHQILMNLSTNAVHAMSQGGGILRFSLSRAELEADDVRGMPELRPGPHVRIQVSDTGHGMEEAVLKRIFEPFFTTKPSGQGTGLGLSVVHGIVKSHHGHIEVRSRPGKGTVFEVFLPALGELAAAPAQSPAPVMGGGQRVLFVDNESAICLVARHALKRRGYIPLVCKDPLEALEQFRKDPQACDLLVTDLSMPGLSGLELAEEIVRQRPDLPVILCSGFMTEDRIVEGRRVGVREFLFKPVDMDVLAQAIARVLSPKVL